MKKVLSLVFCAVMLLALSLIAFALETDPSACCTNHTMRLTSTAETRIVYPEDRTCCATITLYTYRCLNCPYTETKRTECRYILTHHYSKGISSRCDGTYQYLTCGCSYDCGTSTVLIQRCPAAGHGGACRWLPF